MSQSTPSPPVDGASAVLSGEQRNTTYRSRDVQRDSAFVERSTYRLRTLAGGRIETGTPAPARAHHQSAHPRRPCPNVSRVIQSSMAKVTVRELRNKGGEVLDRVLRGDTVIVTRDGHEVAELRPLPPRALDASALLARWRHLPVVDPVELRRDIDSFLDASL